MKEPKRSKCYNIGCMESKYNKYYNFAGICDFRKNKFDIQCNSKEIFPIITNKLIKKEVLK